MFPDEAFAITCIIYMEAIFLAEATIQKQKMNERHMLWHYSQFR